MDHFASARARPSLVRLISIFLFISLARAAHAREELRDQRSRGGSSREIATCSLPRVDRPFAFLAARKCSRSLARLRGCPSGRRHEKKLRHSGGLLRGSHNWRWELTLVRSSLRQRSHLASPAVLSSLVCGCARRAKTAVETNALSGSQVNSAAEPSCASEQASTPPPPHLRPVRSRGHFCRATCAILSSSRAALSCFKFLARA